MNRLIAGLLLWTVLVLSACRHRDPLDVDVSAIRVPVRIDRFDRKFYGASPGDLPALKRQYPWLFPAGVPDSVWTAKMQDSLFLRLKRQVDSVFPDNRKLEPPLEDVFKHIKYYFPRFRAPRVLTLYSDWDYTKRAVAADSLLFLFPDNFLGADNPVYAGIPYYIARTMTPEHIPVFAGMAYAEHFVPYPSVHTFLNKMIYYGKLLYLTKAFAPHLADTLLLQYSAKKLQWARDNEAEVWLYFMDNKLLYSTDPKLDARFLDLGPFSKFYTVYDRQSPGMIGRYYGYRIVSEYMKRTHTPPVQMLQKPAEEIFRQSHYKPE